MQVDVIKKLNNLNEQFYKKVGPEFDRTRQQYWKGWDTLIPLIKKKYRQNELSVLDLACGNARFGRFLAEYFPDKNIQYHGIDREETLLNLSQSALQATHLQFTLEKQDIIQALLDKNLFSSKDTYDIVMVFGLLHHVPSQALREELVKALEIVLKPQGILVITSWQFATLPRFSERFINPEVVDLHSEDLEKNDYILDWKRVETAYRYCHFANEAEVKNLIEANTKLQVIDSYYADGKTHSLNCYSIAEKI